MTAPVFCFAKRRSGSTSKGEDTTIARRKSGQAINDQIQYSKVRLIDASGGMVGIVPIEQAQQIADASGMDLVLISPNPDNPVCRVMDYGKYQYEQAKRDREARKRQQTIEVKEVGLKLSTEEHDLAYKLRNAERFLNDGNRVKISIRFRGREMAYTNQGYDVMAEVAKRLEETAVIDRPARVEGRNMVMFLAPRKDNK
ncbi:MAG: translation initiation factor IF-3 [Bacillota bacterium]|nr:translation initiation factor IF-3 [Bacillota bacterium]